MEFVCGCIVGVDGSGADDCSFAFAAAVSRGAELDAVRAQLEQAQYEGKRDYEDVRKFQGRFIEADHERIELRAELDAARAEVAETKRMYSQDNAHWYCPFCQKDVYMPTPLSIKEHTLVCVGHPMRGVEKKRDSALARAERFYNDLGVVCSQLSELQARLGAVTDAAQELVDIFQGLIDGDKFVYDSFTLQPMRAALAAAPAGKETVTE